MSCCRGTDERARKSKRIDRLIRENSPKDKVKLLLLGPGESGKSTIFKQLKIIQNNGGFSVEELQKYRYIVHTNCIAQMKVLVSVAIKKNVNFDSEENEASAQRMQNAGGGESWSNQLALDIKTLWSDSGIQNVYSFRHEYQLNDSANFFF